MGYFSKSLYHSANKKHAEYGTVNSTSSEKGTDNKKNNTSEYNHQYYETHKNKWAREGKYDPNGDDEDFKKVYGDDLKNPKLNMDTHIQGTDFYSVTNKSGQIVLINGDKKWTLPKGVKLTDEMKQALAGIDSNGGKQGEEFLSKMAKFLDDAAKKQPGQGHGSSGKNGKKSSEAKEATTDKKSSGSVRSFDEAKADYNKKKKENAQNAAKAANEKGKKQTGYYKKKTIKHYDNIGSVLISDLDLY